MKAVAVIAEYNPFHTGHTHHIRRIREDFGEETVVIALMSGNFVQRGDLAVADKWLRARAAVHGGVDLVLELPFPYSLAGAEFFATAGVRLATALGGIDALSFGSECAVPSLLSKAAENMLSPRYLSALRAAGASRSKNGFAHSAEAVYRSLFPEEYTEDLFRPNSILALEYEKALIRESSPLLPHVVLREGDPFTQTELNGASHPSASALRAVLPRHPELALSRMPSQVASLYREALTAGECPADPERIAAAVLSYFRLNPAPRLADLAEAKGGLYTRLAEKSREANGIASLVTLAETKKYTNARLRRAMWFSFFGVTSSELREPPAYTQVLALNGRGQAFLKAVRRTAKIPVLTKPSALRILPPHAIPRKQAADRADEVYELAKPLPSPATELIKHSPAPEK